MAGILCAVVGAGGVLDTQSVTVGNYSGCDKFSCWEYHGFSSVIFPGFGSISDGSFNPKGGATINTLYWEAFGDTVVFAINGGPLTNDGWGTMTINGTPFTRSSASFTSDATYTTWSWTGVTTNPFTADSTVTTVVFT